MGKTKDKVKKIKNENVRQRVQKSFGMVLLLLGIGSLIGISACS